MVLIGGVVMHKLRKYCLIGIGLLIAISIVVSMIVKLYNEKCYWQRKAAYQNYHHWSQIYDMTTEIEKIGFTRNGLQKMFLYINAIAYDVEEHLSPCFSGGTHTSRFLQTYYNGLALDIAANAEMDDETLQVAIDLFEETTKELRNLSLTIIEMTEDMDAKLALIDTDSELYKQVDTMVKDYSNAYSERISDFFAGLRD